MKKFSIPWETIKGAWGQLFAQKDENFWEDETMKLPEKWQKVVK